MCSNTFTRSVNKEEIICSLHNTVKISAFLALYGLAYA